MRALPCLIGFWFVMFGVASWRPALFLKGDGGGVDRSGDGGRGNCGRDVLYERSIYFQSKKKKTKAEGSRRPAYF